MKILREATEEEMILAFLQMEINSNRFRDEILHIMSELNLPLSLVTGGDLSGADENASRALLLKEFRGYPDREIFEDYPAGVQWKFAQLERGDIEKLRYIDYSYWNELSNNTHKPTEGAKSVKAGIRVFDVPNDNFFEALESLENNKSFAPIILMTFDGDTYKILEGHVRSTVYALKPGSEADSFAYIGIPRA